MRNGTDWKLCWRASRDGWNANTFHYQCDEKGPTITIIRVGKYIFGGYTSLPWPSKYYNEDDLRVQCEVYPRYWSVCVGCLSLPRGARFSSLPPNACSTENTTKTWPQSYRFAFFLSFAKVVQCLKYSKIWLNLIFVALNLTFIRGQKAFPVFLPDRVVIRLPCARSRPTFQNLENTMWLAKHGKGMLSNQLSRRLGGGMKNELPQKCQPGRLRLPRTRSF